LAAFFLVLANYLHKPRERGLGKWGWGWQTTCDYPDEVGSGWFSGWCRGWL